MGSVQRSAVSFKLLSFDFAAGRRRLGNDFQTCVTRRQARVSADGVLTAEPDAEFRPPGNNLDGVHLMHPPS
jgi:hypothetical protein